MYTPTPLFLYPLPDQLDSWEKTQISPFYWTVPSPPPPPPAPSPVHTRSLTQGCTSSLPLASPPSGPRSCSWGPHSTRRWCPCWGRCPPSHGCSCRSSCGRPRRRSSRWTRSCSTGTRAPPCGWSCQCPRGPPAAHKTGQVNLSLHVLILSLQHIIHLL